MARERERDREKKKYACNVPPVLSLLLTTRAIFFWKRCCVIIATCRVWNSFYFLLFLFFSFLVCTHVFVPLMRDVLERGWWSLKRSSFSWFIVNKSVRGEEENYSWLGFIVTRSCEEVCWMNRGNNCVMNFVTVLYLVYTSIKINSFNCSWLWLNFILDVYIYIYIHFCIYSILFLTTSIQNRILNFSLHTFSFHPRIFIKQHSFWSIILIQ